jgi:hypothetical protein
VFVSRSSLIVAVENPHHPSANIRLQLGQVAKDGAQYTSSAVQGIDPCRLEMSFIRRSVVNSDGARHTDNLIPAPNNDPGIFDRDSAPFRLTPGRFGFRQERVRRIPEGTQANILKDFPIVSSKHFDVQVDLPRRVSALPLSRFQSWLWRRHRQSVLSVVTLNAAESVGGQRLW